MGLFNIMVEDAHELPRCPGIMMRWDEKSHAGDLRKSQLNPPLPV
jgi:hypothetical protein